LPADPPQDLNSLPMSSLYAVAAARAGCPYVNFTPSLGAGTPLAAAALAEAGVAHAGADGKTGETLVKSALAPMFAVRALDVMSWSGQNLLGNLDGKVLSDPAAKEAKVKTKSAVLSGVLGYEPESRVGIDYVSSLGDWKVAWDFIHFQGVLGVPMRMQFTWEGCDSILAAPLLLDLARLMAWADAHGETGALGWLGVFFKSPMGEHSAALSDQFRELREHLGLV
jgi:myo-inositol-1-phosphate synthase